MTDTGREVHLAERPHGVPTVDNFRIVEAPVPTPSDGEVLVRNSYFSVDPYMRGRMNAGKSYVPPFEVGQVMDGGAIGEVIASESDALPVGATVLHRYGWRDYAAGPAEAFQPVDPTLAPTVSAYLGALGMPSFTAYVGLLDIAEMRAGDAVFVSAAAGAVGSIAGQIARLRGASRVIGSAGTDAKVAYLRDTLGFDAAFNYKTAPVAEQLKKAAPEGIDVYFDNVGGDHLEAAIGSLNRHGRVAACGAISVYNATEPPPGPRNLGLIVGKRLTIRGFIVGDHNDRQQDFAREVGGWLRDGSITFQETVVEGIERSPEAFLGLLRGDNIGKMVVKLHD
ncbi:MAG TPA: NADP-dependent oxidoreductase [Mycobacteriales bacterium]|nr:NADP-dependent oxidoreductase [Mycobacteriales bacterium]